MTDKSSIPFSKVKPRDFGIQAKTLTILGATHYDKLDDINLLKLEVAKTIKAQQLKWKTMDPAKLRQLIKRQVVYELSRIEERKQVRRDMRELAIKKEEQRQLDLENQDLLATQN